MRTATTELLPVWRSDLQPLILSRLNLLGEQTASDIAVAGGADPSMVARHAARLERAGVLVGRHVGRSRLLRINRDHAAAAALATLADLTIGVYVELQALWDLAGVERVAIFGSWARRHLGEPGPPPNDVDVLVETSDPAVEWAIRGACLAIAGRQSIAIDVWVIAQGTAASFPPLADGSAALVELGRPRR